MEVPVVHKLFVEGKAVGKHGVKKDAQKMLAKWGVDMSTVTQIRKPHGKLFMMITFTHEAALDAAQTALKAPALALRVERKHGGVGMEEQPRDTTKVNNNSKKRERADTEGGGEQEQEQEQEQEAIIHDVRDVLTPLWRMSYEEQCVHKQRELSECLGKLRRGVAKENGTREGMDWPLKELEPLVEALPGAQRNKVTFTIGRDAEGQPCVGHRVGRTKEGSTSVAPPGNVANMSAPARAVRDAAAELVKKSALPPFHNVTREGFWRSLEVRSNERGQWVAVLQYMAAGVDAALVASVRDEVRAALLAVPGCVGLGWCQSLLLHTAEVDWSTVEWLHGDGVLEEELGLDRLLFRIPPGAFFQTCTPGCVVLYDGVTRAVAAEAQRLGGHAHLFDVCCGIGSIGLYLRRRLGSDMVRNVVGIDIVPQAIAAARLNALAGGFPDGMHFIAGAAEDVLEEALKKNSEAQLICVVDPPRAGLHPRVVRALRTCPAIKSLIYVSCNPRSLVKDLIPLTKKPTKRYGASPFVPISLQGYDMFAGADHVEAICVLRRMD